MITTEDLDNMGYSDYMRERARLYSMTPMHMVEEFATTMDQPKDPDMSAGLIYEEFDEWRWERQVNRPKDYRSETEIKELADLVYVIYGYAHSRGWDLDEALRRVHKSNMERCVWPDGSIKRREDGKILKNPDAPKIQLDDLV